MFSVIVDPTHRTSERYRMLLTCGVVLNVKRENSAAVACVHRS